MQGFCAEGFEQGGGFGGQCFGVGAGGLQAHQFDVGGFVVIAVFAGGFAQSGGVGFAVQYIVDDLERQAEFGGVVVSGLDVV